MAAGTIPIDPNSVLCCRSFVQSTTQTKIKIYSTATAASYLIVMIHRLSGDRKPYVVAVSDYNGTVSAMQLTTNTSQITADALRDSGNIHIGVVVTTPGMMSGYVLMTEPFDIGVE